MSGRRDGSYVRSERLVQIARQIAYRITNSKTKQCSIEELNLWIQFDLGLTEKRATEYVDLVVRAKGWLKKDGFIETGLES